MPPAVRCRSRRSVRRGTPDGRIRRDYWEAMERVSVRTTDSIDSRTVASSTVPAAPMWDRETGIPRQSSGTMATPVHRSTVFNVA